jgi:hypothetical protein
MNRKVITWLFFLLIFTISHHQTGADGDFLKEGREEHHLPELGFNKVVQQASCWFLIAIPIVKTEI